MVDQDYLWAADLVVKAPSPEAGRFRIVFSRDFHKEPPPEWEIDGLVMARAPHLVFGPYGAAKTFIVLEESGAFVTGAPAFGHFEVLKRGSVVAFMAEATNDIKAKRWPAYCAAHDLDPRQENFDGHRLAIVDRCPLVKDPKDVAGAIEAIEREGVEPVHIVIDNVACALGDLNETQSSDLYHLTNTVARLIDHFGCSVTLVANTPADTEKPRGGLALPDAMGVIWGLSKLTADFGTLMTNKKMKSESTGAAWKLQGSRYPAGLVGRDGQPLHSLAFKCAGPVSAEARRMRTPAEEQEEFRLCVKLVLLDHPGEWLTEAKLARLLAPANPDAMRKKISRSVGILRNQGPLYDYVKRDASGKERRPWLFGLPDEQ